MITPLLGDPGSMSALGASLRRTAVRLSADSEDLERAADDATPGWSGPRATGLRQRVSTTAEETKAVAAALDDAGKALQAAATDLSTAIARLRELEDAAAAAGLELREGGVTKGWGITGVADAATVRDEDRERERLQERVHQAVSALGQKRSRLATELDRASTLLRASSAHLRR